MLLVASFARLVSDTRGTITSPHATTVAAEALSRSTPAGHALTSLAWAEGSSAKPPATLTTMSMSRWLGPDRALCGMTVSRFACDRTKFAIATTPIGRAAASAASVLGSSYTWRAVAGSIWGLYAHVSWLSPGFPQIQLRAGFGPASGLHRQQGVDRARRARVARS